MCIWPVGINPLCTFSAFFVQKIILFFFWIKMSSTFYILSPYIVMNINSTFSFNYYN